MTSLHHERSHHQDRSVYARAEALFEVSWYCPERPYVELRVPLNIKSIRAVNFKTVSHDQGKLIIQFRFKAPFLFTKGLVAKQQN